MKKNILLSIFYFCVTIILAQNEEKKIEISQLAKKYAEALCTCPVQDFMIAIAEDFKEKKISPEEFKEGIKMVGAQMIQCTRHILKQIKHFSPDEGDFFKAETKKYNAQFFEAQKKAAKNQP